MNAISARLADAARTRQLLPFIGAGFSKNVDPGIPSWSELMTIAAKRVDFDPAVLTMQGDQYQIGQYLYATGMLADFYDDLRSIMHPPAVSVGMSAPHTLLPYIDTPYVFTTNWDHWIEKGFEQESVPYRSVIHAADLRAAPLAAPRTGAERFPQAELDLLRTANPSSQVVKFHGDLDDDDSLVFKESDYFSRLAFDHHLDILLRSQILQRSVVFIGYSFTDFNVRYIWHKLAAALSGIRPKDRVRSFFVTSKHFPVQHKLLGDIGIEIVRLEPTDVTGSLTRLFEEILKLQR